MNCNDYLSMLATLPVDELAYGHAREHTLACQDCDRVTRVVVERERNLRLAFSDLQSSVPAAQAAVWAIERSRRQRIARYVQMGLGIAMAATVVLYVGVSRLAPTSARVPTVSEMFRLKCLSPDQAAVVLRPYLAAAGIISLPKSTPGIVVIQAPYEDMQKVRATLDHYDNPAQSACAVRVVVPKEP